MREESLLLLVGDWVNSADTSLVDKIVSGLLPYFFLNRQSHSTAIQLSVTVSKSVLAAQHPLLSGMKDFVRKKGNTLQECTISRLKTFFSKAYFAKC